MPAFEFLVAGNVNLTTTLRLDDGFPVAYAKMRCVPQGVRDAVSGVGFNVAAGLARLGSSVRLAALIGDDGPADLIERDLRAAGIDAAGLRRDLLATPRAVVLRDASGQGAIFTDLKNLQEASPPLAWMREQVQAAQRVHVGNVEWALQLAREAKRQGKIVSTDVQAIRDPLADAYNRRFLEVAEIVFFSAENLAMAPADALRSVLGSFPARIAVCGLGERGALMASRREGSEEIDLRSEPAASGPPIENATGGGDALAAGFLSALSRGHAPEEALRQSQEFAGARLRS